MNKPIIFIMSVSLLAAACGGQGEIDRHALVTRNNPHVTEVNPLHSLNLGNGEFAVTLDATGLQTFPEFYSKGLSLGTYSEWGWHSFPNVEGYTEAETLEDHPLPGHPHGLYAVQNGFGMSERGKAAAEWVRANPHRLHLGNFGFEGMKPGEISEVDQTLDMWDGVLVSSFKWNGMPVSVETVCAADDVVAASVKAASPLPLVLRFPYPTGVHTDDASAWDRNWLHSTEVVSQTGSGAVLKRIVDDTVYYVAVKWTGDASFEQNGRNVFNLVPESGEFEFSVAFAPEEDALADMDFAAAKASASELWNGYWNTTGVIDFSDCTDERAPHAGALTTIPAGKVVADDSLYDVKQKLQASVDKDTAAAIDQELAANVDRKFGHWGYKSTLQMGPAYIYGDVHRLMLAQSEKMGASLGDVVRYMTLVIPAQLIPFFTAKKGIFISAYEMLKVAFPELKIITLPDLIKDKEQFALLLCDDPAYGKPGYLVLHDGQPIRAFDPDDRITAIKYDLAVPEHKLVITNPEQIAVLEGI